MLWLLRWMCLQIEHICIHGSLPPSPHTQTHKHTSLSLPSLLREPQRPRNCNYHLSNDFATQWKLAFTSCLFPFLFFLAKMRDEWVGATNEWRIGGLFGLLVYCPAVRIWQTAVSQRRVYLREGYFTEVWVVTSITRTKPKSCPFWQWQLK